jgi:hypothetical protein
VVSRALTPGARCRADPEEPGPANAVVGAGATSRAGCSARRRRCQPKKAHAVARAATPPAKARRMSHP